LLFVFFLFCAKITHADNSKRVDSLEQALVSTKEDISQISILLKPGIYFKYNRVDTAIEFGIKALAISEVFAGRGIDHIVER